MFRWNFFNIGKRKNLFESMTGHHFNFMPLFLLYFSF
jgi:hypothetical protein